MVEDDVAFLDHKRLHHAVLVGDSSHGSVIMSVADRTGNRLD